jgi:glycosyltransferase involved in cell wall biosynthesis
MRIGIDARKIADFGIGTYIRNLLRELPLLGGEDSYVALAPERLAHLVPSGVERVELDAPHYSLRELFAAGSAIERARLDLFHAPHYVTPFTRVPTVVTIHDLIHLRHPHLLKRAYARRMLRRAVEKSRRVLTVSETVKREIVETFGCEEEHVVVTPNGADPRFRPHGPRQGGQYFLYAGNDKPHKNVDLLVAAFELAQWRDTSRGPTLPARAGLILAGAGFERFRRRATLAGFVSDDELAALYRGAIALVLPSSEEGFGLPALEAMASGTAVITSKAPALVGLTGDAALHAELSIDALSEAMVRVANDASLRESLAARGAERAREFTWTRCAERTRIAYRAR